MYGPELKHSLACLRPWAPQALMPAHYQILHAGGIRELIQHKSSYTCRNGETVFMSSSNKALVPVSDWLGGWDEGAGAGE